MKDTNGTQDHEEEVDQDTSPGEDENDGETGSIAETFHSDSTGHDSRLCFEEDDDDDDAKRPPGGIVNRDGVEKVHSPLAETERSSQDGTEDDLEETGSIAETLRSDSTGHDSRMQFEDETGPGAFRVCKSGSRILRKGQGNEKAEDVDDDDHDLSCTVPTNGNSSEREDDDSSNDKNETEHGHDDNDIETAIFDAFVAPEPPTNKEAVRLASLKKLTENAPLAEVIQRTPSVKEEETGGDNNEEEKRRKKSLVVGAILLILVLLSATAVLLTSWNTGKAKGDSKYPTVVASLAPSLSAEPSMAPTTPAPTCLSYTPRTSYIC
jgi:hypothetical protein